jgi:hypothetical protein
MRVVLPSCAALALLAACAPPRQVSESGFGAYEVSLATFDDGLILAWYDTRHGNAELYVRPLDAAGGEAGPELRLTTTDEQSYEADIAPLGDSFAVAWYEKAQDDALRAQLGVWGRDGTPRWTTPVAVGVGNSRNPVVRSYRDALFCAWIEAAADGTEMVWGGWWDLDGRPRGAPAALGPASANTWNLNAAVGDSGSAVVVFDAKAGTQVEELFLATLADDAVLLTQLSTDDGMRSKYPDIALAGADAALTWFDERDGNKEVYLAVAPLRGLSAAGPHARRITSTTGESIGAYVAWNRQRIGLAWSDDSDGNYEVYFQSFDAVNYPQAPPQRLTETATDSLIPAIKPWRDGFAVAWDEVAPSPAGVHDEATRAEVLFTVVR